MNPDLTTLLPHASKRISELVRQRDNAIDLTVGESRFGPPQCVVDALIAALEDHGTKPWPYAAAAGDAALRQSVAQYVGRATNIAIDPSAEVVITNGAAEAIWLTVFAMTAPGDEVILGDPAYALYEGSVRALGRKPVRVRSRRDEFGEVSVADVERSLTARTKLLVLNSPENPTGTVYRPNTIRELAALCTDRNIYLAHDEVFDFMTYDAPHLSALAATTNRERILSINSISKRFGLTGWRIGWLIAAPTCARELAKAHTFLSLACPAPLQRALVSALAAPETDAILRSRAEQFGDATRTAASRLCELGFRPFSGVPRGGFNLFLDVTMVFERLMRCATLAKTHDLDIKRRTRGELVAHLLLEECGVAVVPGNAFGPAGDDFVRVSVAGAPELIDEAITRLEQRLLA